MTLLSNYINKFIQITTDFEIKIYVLNDKIKVLHEDSKDYYDNTIKQLSELIHSLRRHIYKKPVILYDKDFNQSMLENLWYFYHDNYIDILAQIDYGYALTIHKSQVSTLSRCLL